MNVTNTPPFTPATALFLDHWKSIRDAGRLVPTLDAWLTQLTATIAVHKWRAELLPDDAMLLFSGSALIARQSVGRAGESLCDRHPWRKKSVLANARTVVHHPCGYGVEMSYVSSLGNHLRVQTIILPLSVPAGRLPQLVGFSGDLAGCPAQETIGVGGKVESVWWLDVGAGIPAINPQ
jgi:hypothetical protein